MGKAGFYAVARGRVPGIYDSWEDCKEQVNGFSGAKCKKFKTLFQAEEFLDAYISTSVWTLTAPHRIKSEPDISLEDTVCEEGFDVVYTDGSCKGQGKAGGVAGIGVWWGHNDPRNIVERCPGTQTPSGAELIAIVRVLETTPAYGCPLMIKTDSKYCINCIRVWDQKWRVNGWKRKKGKDVPNARIIRYLLSLISLRRQQGSEVKFVHVKGHAGIEGNVGADRQANLGTLLDEVEEPDWDEKRVAVEMEIDELEQSVKVMDEWAVQVTTVTDDDDELRKNVGDLDVEVLEESQYSAANVTPSASNTAPAPVTKTDDSETDDSETSAKPSQLADASHSKQNEPAQEITIVPESDDVDDLLSPEKLEAELANA